VKEISALIASSSPSRAVIETNEVEGCLPLSEISWKAVQLLNNS
jgi:ribosomal protein S1